MIRVLPVEPRAIGPRPAGSWSRSKTALVPEPFLVVALIAGVRRVLILTTEASQYIQSSPEQFRMALREMILLMVSFLVLAVSIVILQRFPTPRS